MRVLPVENEPRGTVTTRIDLLRHGQCEGGDLFRGHLDVELTPAGFAQMQRACAGGQWHAVISSPLQRCWQFARTVSSIVVADSRLRETSFGDWDGKSISEVWRNDHDRVSAWSRNPAVGCPPNGEPLHEVAARVDEFLKDCLRDYCGKNLLLVTHGGVVRMLLTQVLGTPIAHANRWAVPYGCFTRLAVYHDPSENQPPWFQIVSHNTLLDE